MKDGAAATAAQIVPGYNLADDGRVYRRILVRTVNSADPGFFTVATVVSWRSVTGHRQFYTAFAGFYDPTGNHRVTTLEF